MPKIAVQLQAQRHASDAVPRVGSTPRDKRSFWLAREQIESQYAENISFESKSGFRILEKGSRTYRQQATCFPCERMVRFGSL